MMKQFPVLATLIALAASSQASTISDSFPIVEASIEIGQTGTLDLFDSDLGTLNGITLTLSGSSTTSITLSLGAAAGQPRTVTGTVTVDLFFDSSIPQLDGLFGANSLIQLSSTTGPQPMQPGERLTIGPLTDGDTQGFDLSGLAQQLSAAGGGTFTISCNSLTGTRLQGGGGFASAERSATAGCGATIDYDYTPNNQAPEPATLALVGLALAGVGRSIRRRQPLADTDK